MNDALKSVQLAQLKESLTDLRPRIRQTIQEVDANCSNDNRSIHTRRLLVALLTVADEVLAFTRLLESCDSPVHFVMGKRKMPRARKAAA